MLSKSLTTFGFEDASISEGLQIFKHFLLRFQISYCPLSRNNRLTKQIASLTKIMFVMHHILGPPTFNNRRVPKFIMAFVKMFLIASASGVMCRCFSLFLNDYNGYFRYKNNRFPRCCCLE